MRITFLLFLLIRAYISFAQSVELPADPYLKMGKLPNGLTYYIRANALPAGQADFYLVQKSGSVQESESQAGLAHFLEHMAFRGSKNFPGRSMVEYLESNGVMFGNNLNAYTSFEETVYNMTYVPTGRDGIIDTALLILHDCSSELLLTDEDIEKERGVIREEWRMHNNASNRIFENLLLQMHPGSHYGHCMPIGSIDVINHFPPEELRMYYNDWYNPDFQCIIVVGDINPDSIEQKIKNIFSGISHLATSVNKPYIEVPDNMEPIIAIATDKEETSVLTRLFYKRDKYPDSLKNTQLYFIRLFLSNMATDMLNSRLMEVSQQANPSFIYATAYDGDYFISRTKEAFMLEASVRENEVEKAVEVILTELKRAREYGFTESEYERVKANFLRSIESFYSERHKQKNDSYIRELIELFLNNIPAPGIEFEYVFWQAVAKEITVDDINMFFKEIPMTDSNCVLSISGPEKEGVKYPDREEIIKLLNRIKEQPVEIYTDNIIDKVLIPVLPRKGKIKKIKEKGIFGTTEWTLSNGIRVILCPTDFKEDEILMTAYSPGGASLIDDKDIAAILSMNSIIPLGGYGEFSPVDISKAIAGKNVSVDVMVSSYAEDILGNCSPADFETMMQLTYLAITSPRKDTTAFNTFISRLRDIAENQKFDPNTVFSDTIIRYLYDNHPRSMRLTPEIVDRIKYDRVLELYKERFTNISDLVFIFSGNIDPEYVKPYIEQYIGALPGKGKKEKSFDTKLEVVKGMVSKSFLQKMSVPKVSIFQAYSGDVKYSLQNKVQMDVLVNLLQTTYIENIRGKESGTYHVYVDGKISQFPREEYSMIIQFDTEPQLRDKLKNIVKKEIEKISTNGPGERELQKAKDFVLKHFAGKTKENEYWLFAIRSVYENNTDMHTGYGNIVEQLTAEDVRKFAHSLFEQNNMIEVIMEPEQ